MKPSELIATPDRWTKGAFARTVLGAPVGINDRGASCFCLVGALIKMNYTTKQYWDAVYKIKKNLGFINWEIGTTRRDALTPKSWHSSNR